MHTVPRHETIEYGEAPRRKDRLQTYDHAAKGLLERLGTHDDAQDYKQHGEKGEEHVERNGLRLRDAVRNDAKHCTVDPMEERFHR
jgi:hypothetical protein